jgi:phosphatidylserine/phosphatidylglycerophosphate/cardiolipin synthase-like enzyme
MSGSRDSLLSRIDSVVGDGVEAAVRAKHRWRLRRLGSSRALAPPDQGLWAAGNPVPRPGCTMDVLIDGAQAFPAIAEAIENARDFIHLTGWHVAPYFELRRPRSLRAALGRAHRRAACPADDAGGYW